MADQAIQGGVMVYLDASIWTLGRMVMCHMIADTQDELHAMAERIGMKRQWFQEPPKASVPHYDVCKARKARALALGARKLDRRAFAEKIRELRAKGWP